MPFFVYEHRANEFVRVKSNVHLAGKNGPFFDAARNSPKKNSPDWEISELNLVASFNVDPVRHAIIIDLKPRDKRKVNLYRIRHVWGNGSGGCTKVAVELEPLYVEKVLPAKVLPATFKTRFPVPTVREAPIYEFLYLGANWSFGRVGGVNAALLWEEVLDSFIRRINLKRRRERLTQLG